MSRPSVRRIASCVRAARQIVVRRGRGSGAVLSNCHMREHGRLHRWDEFAVRHVVSLVTHLYPNGLFEPRRSGLGGGPAFCSRVSAASALARQYPSVHKREHASKFGQNRSQHIPGIALALGARLPHPHSSAYKGFLCPATPWSYLPLFLSGSFFCYIINSRQREELPSPRFLLCRRIETVHLSRPLCALTNL